MKRFRQDLFCKALVCTIVVLLNASAAHAIDRCKVKVDKRTGVILTDASGVGGPLAWGEASGQETNAFFNAGTCVTGDKAKRCQLANPLTLASKTAPAGCTLYLDDGVTPCSAWIPGCSPGARRDTAIVIKDSNGLALGTADASGQTAVRDESGTSLKISVIFDGSGFFAYGGFYYTSNDCTGTPLIGADASMLKQVYVVGATGYYGPTTQTNTAIGSFLNAFYTYVDQTQCDNSFGVGNTTFVPPHGCCQAFVANVDVNPAQTIDLSAFVPPFHVEVQ